MNLARAKSTGVTTTAATPVTTAIRVFPDTGHSDKKKNLKDCNHLRSLDGQQINHLKHFPHYILVHNLLFSQKKFNNLYAKF